MSVKKLSIFWCMPFKLKMMLIISFFLCGVARAAINILPLSKLAPYFGIFYKTTALSQLVSKQQLRQAIHIGQSVRLAAKYTPWNSSCLTQAMVAKCWCQLFKIPYAFYIGFAKSTDSSSGYDAQAWITSGPVVLTTGLAFLIPSCF